MQIEKEIPPAGPQSPPRLEWRHWALICLVFGSLAGVLAMKKIPQDLRYHQFADRRTVLGIPNFSDVASNLPFLIIGLAGMALCRRNRGELLRASWTVFFAGVALVSAGSAYYHWDPRNETLVWDRLPITIGFMGMFAALLGEFVNLRLGRRMLLPATVAGLLSVVYWQWTDDLRLYAWVQFAPLMCIPVVLVLFRGVYSHDWMIPIALGLYVLAKGAESYDVEIFKLTGGQFCGHTLKHLLAAGACYTLFLMLKNRTPSGRRLEASAL